MRISFIPHTRGGRIRMIALAAILPLLFLAIWLFTVKMPGPPFAGPLPPLTPNQELIRAGLQRHVRALAHDIGVRSDQTYSNVLRASAYIERRLQDLGYKVETQEFAAGNRSYRNIEATLGGAPGHAHEVVVLGAHYDTAEGAPGADDNASGVAGVLELARIFAQEPQARTVRFVFFPNEEPPSFPTADMGSRHYASAARERNDQIVAMLSIESIGYYDTEQGSQRYPFYHTPQDTPDKLDYDRMARVVHGLTHVVRALAN